MTAPYRDDSTISEKEPQKSIWAQFTDVVGGIGADASGNEADLSDAHSVTQLDYETYEGETNANSN